MKRKLYIIPLMLSALALASCGGSKLHGYERFLTDVKNSEQSFNKYSETAEIKDGDMVIYSKVTDFNIKREENLRTDVEVTTLKLSDDGSGLLPSFESYWTIGDKKYEKINDEVFETSYTAPKYFLTFVPQKEYFEEGYELTEADGNITLKGKILNSEISAFFANKTFTGVTDVNVEIKLEKDRLKSFDASYKTKSMKDASIHTSYQYPVETNGKTDYIEAIFHLEGGECKGITDKVYYRYDLHGGYETLIIDPLLLQPDSIKRVGYHIEGWYKTKTVDGDKVTYSDKWDFTTDKMDRNGVELYAKWSKDTHHTYDVYYKDEVTGKETLIQSYTAEKGSPFNDFLNSQNSPVLKGRTLLGFKDESGQPWNNNFTHPGGEVDTAVKVYADTIEGEYQVVKTAHDFENINPNKNVYLAADIDLRNKQISFKGFTGIFLGNGHTISNARIKYDATRKGLEKNMFDPTSGATYLYISLFKDIKPIITTTQNEDGSEVKVETQSQIRDVNFENFNVELKATLELTTNIIFAPLAIRANNAVIDNVSFTGNFEITRAPKNADIKVITDSLVYNSTGATIEDTCRVNVKLIDNRK